MDNPGQSTFIGGSLQLEGIGAHSLNDEEESLEDEEENRWREAELRNMMTDGFDDLKDDSYDESIGDGYSRLKGDKNAPTTNVNPRHFLPSQVTGGGPLEDRKQVEGHVEASYVQHTEDAGQFGYGDTQSSYTEYHRGGNYGGDSVPDSMLENDGAGGRVSRSCSEGGSIGHQSAGDYHNVPPEGSLTFDSQADGYNFDDARNKEAASVSEDREIYNANNYQSNRVGEDTIKALKNRYREADTPHHQLKLLYEARGRELDQQMEEIKKLKYESSRDIRTLHHEQALLKSEVERKGVSLDQLKSLLSEKEEQTRTLKSDLHELQSKLKNSQDENHKLNFELESARSVISSLEIRVSQLQAADCLTKNQQLHEDFTRKLKQSNQEEKELLLSKLEESRKEVAASSQEVKRLRDELRNMRSAHDKAVREKTEALTEHTITVETMRKQYNELLQCNDSRRNLELQLKIQNLESNNQELKDNIRLLDEKLNRTEDELRGYEMAVKYGLFSDLLPEEDSMNPLGIKKTLTYDDAQTNEVQRRDKRDGKDVDATEKINLGEELKKCLLLIKAKRDEIAGLNEELCKKQDVIKKSQSAQKDACTRVQELQRELMELKLELAERPTPRDNRMEDHPNVLSLKAENVALHQELTLLLNPVREFKESLKAFSDIIESWKNNTATGGAGEDLAAVIRRCSELLDQVESFRKSISNVEEHLDQIRRENYKLHDKYTSWEKKLHDINIQVKVSQTLIIKAKTDSEGSDAKGKTYWNTHEKLLDDLKQLLKDVKKEKSDMDHENMDLQDQVTKVGLDRERLKLVIKELSEERANLKLNMADLARRKDEEKKEALESCQSTYMKFHEEAVRELKAKLEAEYESIAGKLKEENARLAEDLLKTKELYIKMCQEKDEIEDRLNRRRQESERQESTASSPDSGVGGESMHQVVQYKKKITDLEVELTVMKERSKDENARMTHQVEQLELKYKKRFQEQVKEIRKEAHKLVEELEKKCATLEECNLILKEKCKKFEEDKLNSQETDSEDVSSSDHEKCVIVQERLQQQLDRLNGEKAELIEQYENLIQDLQNKFTKTESTKLLEDLIAQQARDVTLLENRVKEQEKEMKSIKNELQRMKDREGITDRESEEEIKKLTDIIQSLESEVRERHEENCNIKATLKKNLEEFKEERERLTHNLQKAEVEVAHLKEVKVKYNTLKQKFIKFQEAHREHIAHYKGELTRLTTEYREAREDLLDRVREYVDAVRDKCVECVTAIIATLRGLDNIQDAVDGTLDDLGKVLEFLKSFTLKLV